MPDTPEQSQDPQPAAPKAEFEPARLSARRRLTRAGLAAPVVLGSLISKPVLGQVPRNCTVSGQVSGNVSSPGMGVCADLGYTPEHWAVTTVWPAGLTAGTPPNKDCKFNGQAVAGTRFSPTFAEAFKYVGTGTNNDQVCTVYAYDQVGYGNLIGQNPGIATMLQVLNLPQSGSFDGARLGRAAVAAYLNALDRPDFPLSPTQVIQMFNQVRQSGTYYVSGNVYWDQKQVTSYFESLWGGKLV